MRHLIKITITNSILRCLTCDAYQSGCIKHTVLIFDGLNIKLGTDGYSPAPPLWTWPKVTYILEDILLWLIILFEVLYEKWRWFQYIWWKISGLNILMCLLYTFCFWCIHNCAHNHLSRTTIIILIQSSIIFIHHTIIRCFIRVNNVCVNKLLPPPNHPSSFAHYLIAYFVLVIFPRENKWIRDKTFRFVHKDLPSWVSA